MRVNTLRYKPNELSQAAVAASRQVWLASLGAAVVSRDWIQTEAGSTFRTLVKEGTIVESRAMRVLGNQLEDGFVRANALWHSARGVVQTSVRQAADSAVLFVKDTLPRALPKIQLPTTAASAKKSVRRITKAKAVTNPKAAKRGTRRVGVKAKPAGKRVAR